MKLNKILLFANLDHPSVRLHVKTVESWAQNKKIELAICRLHEEPPPITPDLILTVGGDGTFLKAARFAAPLQVPLLGFHLGGLGFLPQNLAVDLDKALEQLSQSEWTIQERHRLAGHFVDGETGDKREFSGLNEVVVSRARPDRFTEIELWQDDQRVASYPGDGVIIATPTGSTAYSLSAGGPIAEPELPIFLVTPLASHQLAIRPLILSMEKYLKLVARFPAQVMVDGERAGALSNGGTVYVSRSTQTTRLVILPHQIHFFDRLVQKLGWSQVLYQKGQPPSQP